MKTAVILFNLGGPDSLSAVKPFLFNLFSDPAIIDLPKFLRLPLAYYISSRRTKEAQEIYAHLGGKSPLLENTLAQASALEKELGGAYKCFVCMRYWRPLTEEVAQEVKAYDPARVVLLPLYPQFSTTTSGSSLKEWAQESKKQGLDAPTYEISCYPKNSGFIEAVAELTKQALASLDPTSTIRILFTAHGLPQRIVAAGDPYQYQVEQTVAKILEKMGGAEDYVISYQSRVGKLKWLTPYTDEEIKRAGREGKSLVVVPVAFVSEHSETLVELDIQYQQLAQDFRVPHYRRVPAVSLQPAFIKGLRDLVYQACQGKGVSAEQYQTCGARNKKCRCRAKASG